MTENIFKKNAKKGIMTCMATHHQGVIRMFWLFSLGALMSSILTYSQWLRYENSFSGLLNNIVYWSIARVWQDTPTKWHYLQTVCLKFRQTDYPRWSGLDRVCGFQYIHYSSKSFPCNLSCSEVGESQTLCGTMGVSSLTFNFQINVLWVWKKPFLSYFNLLDGLVGLERSRGTKVYSVWGYRSGNVKTGQISCVWTAAELTF